MKRTASRILTIILILTILTAAGLASSPGMINYQGFLRDPSGDPVSGTFTLTFKIYDDALGGDALWQEVHVDVPVSNGQLSVILGEGDPPVAINDSVFEDSDRWLGITIGDDQEVTPRTRLVSVPYSQRVNTIEGAEAGIIKGILEIGPVSKDLGRYESGILITGSEDDSVIISPADDVVLKGTADNGSPAILMTTVTNLSAYGGVVEISSSDAAKAGTRKVLINPTDSVILQGIDGDGDIAVNLGMTEYGGTIHISSSDAAKMDPDAITGSVLLSGDGVFVLNPTETDTTLQLLANGDILGVGQIALGQNSSNPGEWSTAFGYNNEALGDTSTISGGADNSADTALSTVGGGSRNTAGGVASVVAGGKGNYIDRYGGDYGSSDYSTIGGGFENGIYGNIEYGGSRFSTIGGGSNNYLASSHVTISGGFGNVVDGAWSTIGGGADNTIDNSSEYVTISGGNGNFADDMGATVGGGEDNTASGPAAVVCGGVSNSAGSYGVVSGGYSNSVSGNYSAILGGHSDTITSSGDYSYLFGIASVLTQDSTFMVDMPHIRFGDETTGYEFPSSDGSSGQVMTTDGNGQLSWTTASGSGSGGWTDDGSVVRLTTATDSVGIGTTSPSEMLDVSGNIHASGTIKSGNSILIDGANYRITSSSGTVGFDNDNLTTTGKASIGPGHSNSGSNAFTAGSANTAVGTCASVSGGQNNKAYGDYSCVAGGGGSAASDSNSAAGISSFIGAGAGNVCTDNYATIGGGVINSAGFAGTVPGGYSNSAGGSGSLAAGTGAKANHLGSIVLADNGSLTQSDSVRTGGNEQMVLRADGGIYLTNTAEAAPYDATNIITTRGGAYLSGNGTSWTDASDRNLKENFTDLDRAEILAKLCQLPISKWNYISESDDVRHIGPMGQDFYRIFGIGRDGKSLSARDLAAVAAAAVQELDRRTEQLEASVKEIEQLRKELNELRTLVRKVINAN